VSSSRPNREKAGRVIGARVEQKVASGEGRLGELYARHVPDAIRLAYLLTGDRGLAEDLGQDAFVRLYGRFGDLRNPDAFPAYLRRTVVNLANSHFRRRRVERSYLEREGSLTKAPELDTEDRMRVRAALQALPYRQRAAVVLRYYEDLPEAQTAEILRCRPGTVKSLLSRGLEALRAELSRSE
jgi:RNA polymerase sigma-70 factor (sigma-E family)